VARFFRDAGPAEAAWLARLPGLVEACREEWSLELGPPFPDSQVGYVAPATRADGTPAVLKVSFPDRETVREGDALELIAGDAAVLLLAADRERNALLLERLDPGTQLWTVADEEEAYGIAAVILGRIWRPVPAEHPFDLLEDYAADWGERLPSTGRGIVAEAAALARELAGSVREEILLHQDFHRANLLSAQREPWLAIDPKPVVGDREYDVAALLRDGRRELLRAERPAAVVERRFDQLAEALELDRERMRAWGIVQTVSWGLGPGGGEDELAVAELIAAIRP
jgi:streptomycin 6-kinase